MAHLWNVCFLLICRLSKLSLTWRDEINWALRITSMVKEHLFSLIGCFGDKQFSLTWYCLLFYQIFMIIAKLVDEKTFTGTSDLQFDLALLLKENIYLYWRCELSYRYLQFSSFDFLRFYVANTWLTLININQ